MSATPHNGKEEDFQLFMALLDSEPLRRQGSAMACTPSTLPTSFAHGL